MPNRLQTIEGLMGETLREIAILVAVFYTLDVFTSDIDAPLWLNWAVLLGCIVSLSLGVALEVAGKSE
jgi:hypothetical protein